MYSSAPLRRPALTELALQLGYAKVAVFSRHSAAGREYRHGRGRKGRIVRCRRIPDESNKNRYIIHGFLILMKDYLQVMVFI